MAAALPPKEGSLLASDSNDNILFFNEMVLGSSSWEDWVSSLVKSEKYSLISYDNLKSQKFDDVFQKCRAFQGQIYLRFFSSQDKELKQASLVTVRKMLEMLALQIFPTTTSDTKNVALKFQDFFHLVLEKEFSCHCSRSLARLRRAFGFDDDYETKDKLTPLILKRSTSSTSSTVGKNKSSNNSLVDQLSAGSRQRRTLQTVTNRKSVMNAPLMEIRKPVIRPISTSSATKKKTQESSKYSFAGYKRKADTPVSPRAKVMHGQRRTTPPTKRTATKLMLRSPSPVGRQQTPVRNISSSSIIICDKQLKARMRVVSTPERRRRPVRIAAAVQTPSPNNTSRATATANAAARTRVVFMSPPRFSK